MSDVLIFSGTEDGRLLAERLSRAGFCVTACVATAYGEELVDQHENLKVLTGRLDENAMVTLMQQGFDHVVDATHPYAVEVSANIKAACGKAGVPYLRLLRPVSDTIAPGARVHTVDSAVEAAAYLRGKSGLVFVSTGSKEIGRFAEALGEPERIIARVLPDEASLDLCLKAGLKKKQIIAMQGPFSEALNTAMFTQTGAAFLVTKESGPTGGFPEKLRSAVACDMETVLIRRPEEMGLDEAGILRALGLTAESATAPLSATSDENVAASAETGSADQTAVAAPISAASDGNASASAKIGAALTTTDATRRVILAGIGMGSWDGMTGDVQRAVREADLLIGADRMLASVSDKMRPTAKTVSAYMPKVIKAAIDESEAKLVTVLLSGDTGFYSGARKLADTLADYDVTILPGASTVSYLAAKAGISWDDMCLISVHGRAMNAAHAVRHNRKVFALVGGKTGIGELCTELVACGLGETTIIIGSNLSYDNESITRALVRDMTAYTADGVSAAIILNDEARPAMTTHGLPDEAFIRGKAPMTKAEIRAVSLTKMGLYADSVIYDIGAGTGSVSIECALRAPEGHVYAIEKKEEAAALCEENKKNFGLSNLTVIRGTAPDGLEELPAPTHAFIGGSTGHMMEVLDVLYAKNPRMRVVITAITLETVAEMTEICKDKRVKDVEIVSLQSAVDKKAGPYHLMMGGNPVYIMSFNFGEEA
ncbi:MAG: precorrin-6A reductase [Lachnospiraceae bacterium]|nr:precorrin-6A reductase [Lachnospiraceae bacterium]